ncbi:MAG: ABC transporter ATP-binding protein [Oscillospiraceae bacterium]|nr:ABC transporter ATP-binding protein [Oscillospiraceae bacterium]
MDSLLSVRNLVTRYETDSATVEAVNDISFDVLPGETLGLVGETGAGKTTTALSILQLLPERTGVIKSGAICYKGEDLLSKSKEEMRLIRGACISMIFQDPMTALNPVLTIGEQIRESLEIHNYDGLSREQLDERVDELLEMVGIRTSRKYDYPHQFSGGMKQRVVIAISLACNPELIIADEPTTALDVTIQAQVLAMMMDLKNRLKTSMIMITHDLGIVAQTCDKVAIMYAGEIVESGTVRDIYLGEKHHPYTVGLFGSIPDLEKETRRLSPIEGIMPDPRNLPTGCKFHPRCAHCTARCEREAPPVYREGSHEIRCHLFAAEDANGN